MENIQTANLEQTTAPINFGHLGAVMFCLIVLLGLTWLKQPQLFSLKKSTSVAENNVPKYYAYVQPEGDIMPLVAGASTNDGPSVINEDGTVSQVDMGEVLGASTEGVVLSLDEVKVNTIADSSEAIKNYFVQANSIEAGVVDSGEFETALSSSNQKLIDAQAQKLNSVKDALLKLSVPQSLVKLQKLKIIQYSASVGVLQNFTQADTNPELVGKYLQEFLKSQQDLDAENSLIAEKFNLTEAQIYNAQ